MDKHCERRHEDNQSNRQEDKSSCIKMIHGLDLFSGSLGLFSAKGGIVSEGGNKEVNDGSYSHADKYDSLVLG